MTLRKEANPERQSQRREIVRSAFKRGRPRVGHLSVSQSMMHSTPSLVAPRLRYIFWISTPLALLAIFIFPFHWKSFATALLGGAIYAAPFIFRSERKQMQDAAHFLATGIGGAICLLAADSYPKIEAYASYYVFAAFAVAAGIGSGAAIIFMRAKKEANSERSAE